jgi:hypothetical protein
MNSLAAGSKTMENRMDDRGSSGKTMRQVWVSAPPILLIALATFGEADINEDPHAARVYVDAVRGSDSNPGTDDHPLASLREAVRLAVTNNRHGVGTRVIARGGIYREALLLPEDANSTDAPITFEAAPDENVTISGADVMAGWQADPSDPTVYSHSWTFSTELCPAPPRWPELKEIVRRREMIIVNGTPWKQALSFKELAPGTFYIDSAHASALLRPPDGTSMHEAVVEAAVRPTLLEVVGRTNVVLRGITFVNANSCVANAAVNLRDSKNLRVEGSSFLWNNWAGLRIADSSRVTVRKVFTAHNGGAGMYGYRLKDVLYEDVETAHNNWRGAAGDFVGWDPSGTKLLLVHNAVLRRFKATDNLARGLWLDTDNANIRIEESVMARNLLDGMLLEASQGPLTVNGSYFCFNGRGRITHTGLLAYSSARVTLTGNTFFDNLGSQIFVGGDPEREFRDWESGEDLKVSSQHWTINGNTVVGVNANQLGFAGNLPPVKWKEFTATLRSDRNRWVNSANKSFFQPPGHVATDLVGWRDRTGQDTHSISTAPPPQVTACGQPEGATSESVQ